jgi:WD40 repeat protein
MMSKSHNNNDIMNGIESHEAPVTAITFAPYGDDLVSAALDGQIKHWDLRPDSCFTSSFAAARDNTKRTLDSCSGGGGGGGRGGVDPSVAYSGRLVPTSFFGNDGNFGNATPKPPSHRQTIRHNKLSSLAIIQPGTRTTATLLSTTAGQITGHSLFGRRSKEPGGYPDFILDGHLADVTCLVPVVGMWDNLARGQRCMGSNSSTSTGAVSTNTRVVFLTGGKDGMVLCWGCNSYFHRDDDESMMHRWERSEDENSNMSIPSSPLFSLLEEPAAAFEDVDTW